MVQSIDARQSFKSGVPFSVISGFNDFINSFLSMFELAKSHASFPCLEVQIFTPKLLIFFSES